MKRLAASLCLSLAALPAGAGAQSLYNAPPADPQVTGTVRGHGNQAPPVRGQYGGGFIEFLMTGRDPSAVAQPVRPDPLARPARARSSDPFAQPATVRAVAPDPFAAQGAVRGFSPEVIPAARPARVIRTPDLAALPDRPDADYGPVRRVVPAQFHRQEVAYDGPHRPGTIVIDTPRRFLYLVQSNGRAIRYGIGVGRPGFSWAGVKSVTMKREWPDWRPPPEMLKRRPDLPRYMAGGIENPLGARALYLGSSLYRIHGTNEPHTIGQAVSSGCIRMTNDDVIDLYNRVGVGARVVVI